MRWLTIALLGAFSSLPLCTSAPRLDLTALQELEELMPLIDETEKLRELASKMNQKSDEMDLDALSKAINAEQDNKTEEEDAAATAKAEEPPPQAASVTANEDKQAQTDPDYLSYYYYDPVADDLAYDDYYMDAPAGGKEDPFGYYYYNM